MVTAMAKKACQWQQDASQLSARRLWPGRPQFENHTFAGSWQLCMGTSDKTYVKWSVIASYEIVQRGNPQTVTENRIHGTNEADCKYEEGLIICAI